MAHDPQKRLTLAPGEWSADADRLIGQALQHATTADIRHQVEHQGARLFYVMDDGKRAGAFVLRVDETQSGAEGVIVAGAGSVEGFDLLATCMPAIESLFVNCKTVRFHTARASLARRLHAMGYEPAEIVCMKKLEKENELLAA